MSKTGEAIAPEAPPRFVQKKKLDASFALFIAAIAGALALLVGLTNGNLIIILATISGLTTLVMMWRLPLRFSVFTLLLLDMTLEAPYEFFAEYKFRTPLYPLGAALLANLNQVTGVKALTCSGTDLLIVYIFAIWFYRRATLSRIDGPLTQTASPMLWGAWFSLLAALSVWVHGLITEGDFANSLWQVQKLLYIPIFFLLFQLCLRGEKDLGSLAKVLVGAACYRALLAVYIYYTVRPDGQPLQFATTHSDTILFADAMALLVILWNERVRKSRWLYLILMAVIGAGMVANHRRIVWVTLGAQLLAIGAMSPWTKLKRRLARAMILLVPVAAIYVAAGWNTQYGMMFKPAQLLRSIVDSKTDSSSEWRDIENYNLQRNITLRPLMGSGFGHEYIEYITLPDVSAMYPQFRYTPHNSVLASWVFAGLFGFTGIWLMLVVLVYLAARSYHLAGDPAWRAGAMVCVCAVIAYISQVYGDIGVSLWLGPLTLAPAMAIAGKLATATGAWPKPKKRLRPRQPLDMRRAHAMPLEPLPLSLQGPRGRR